MSVDTQHMRPASTVSLWATFRLHLDAERATKSAAERRALDAQPTPERTAADALKDVQRYQAWLTVPAVVAGGSLKADIETKLAVAKAELRLRRRQERAL